MSGAPVTSQRDHLQASLHALSQPLTVVSLALTLAQASSTAAERELALEAAVTECERAMNSVRQLRSWVDGSVPPKLAVGGRAGRTKTGLQCGFGGAVCCKR